ncbi:MAG TPA: hypothetical protein VNH18_10990 [Bryobacteraceae bacterium]|nr:hypothetical protein [Bryobacteraceae bacterium]
MLPNPDWKEFIELLNSNGVEYVVVGALALGWHGYPRFTGDVDFMVRPEPVNAERVVTALGQFGFASLGITPTDLVTEDCIIQLGHPPVRIDLITSISGVSFDDVWAGRVRGDFDGVPVDYIGRAELIRNKRATGRLKDLGDVEELLRRELLP